jgi:uncharacterized iron-regulated membrane protein
MRKIHRWFALAAVLFLVIVAATGIILQVQKLTGADANDPDNIRVSSAYTTVTDPVVYAAMFDRALVVARARAPHTPIATITFQSGDLPKVLVRLPGEPGRQITVDGSSGKVLADEEFEPETLMQRIHDGSILGDSGVVMGVLWGSALVLLTITGFWVYFDMYRRRLRVHGKGKLFW